MRLLVVLLLLANALLLALNLGVLDPLLGKTAGDHEPERLARQVNPAWLSVLPPAAASAALAAAASAQAAAQAASAAAADLACVVAGPFAGPDTDLAERQFAGLALPASVGQLERGARGGSYLVYMGRYADEASLQRKLEELKRLRVDAEPIRASTGDSPAVSQDLLPGLVLGRAETAAAANAALADLHQAGVRTARVLTLRAATPLLVLRLPAADATLRERLRNLAWPSGLSFGPCDPATAGAADAASAPTAR